MEMITAEEKVMLEARLEELRSRRQEIVNRVAEARAMGDLSENAEYHAAREDLALNDAEVRRVETRLKTARVVEKVEGPSEMVFMGSIVKLRDQATDNEDLYKIVGEASGRFDGDEIEVTTGSPMGEALMKARVGDVVKVDLPRGTKRFEVLEIR